MIRYETLLLTVPEITSDETKALETNFEKLINEHKSSLISFERWGKYRLAYPVRKNDYGVYFLARFEARAESLDGLLKALHLLMAVKYNELIMRQVTCRLNQKAPLSYHRPESLEETPTRDVETFLRDSKMSGLLSGRSDTRQDRSRPRSGSRDRSEKMEEFDDIDVAEGAA